MEIPGMTVPDRPPGSRETLESLARRVAALEAHLGLTAPEPTLPTATDPLPPSATTVTPAGTGGSVLSALGISLLMLAGAFLLRAVTGAGMLPGNLGAAVGLGYLLALLVITDREGRKADLMRARLFGTATVLVAFPFLLETSSGLGLLPGILGALAFVLVTTLSLLVAARHRLLALAWLALAAAEVVGCVLFWKSGAPLAFLAGLIWVGGVTLWLGYLGDVRGLRWLGACVVNFVAFITAILATGMQDVALGRPRPDPEGALTLALALPALYLATFGWQTLWRGRQAGLFEITQSLAGLAAGLGGALALLASGTGSRTLLGGAVLLVAAAAYTVAFRFVRRRQGRGLNFFYYAWLGLVLTLVGSYLLVGEIWLPLLWTTLGLVSAAVGGAHDRWTLRLHCAAYLLGAASVSGLGAVIWRGFVSGEPPTWSTASVTGLLVWLATLVGYGMLAAAQRERQLAGWQRIPRFLVAVLILIGGGFLAVTSLSDLLQGTLDAPRTAVLAGVRTAVLAGAAILMAALGRREQLRELSWLTYPLLVLVGVKVLLADLRQGTPISLFIGFACFGIALIVAPRLRRSVVPTGGEAGPDNDMLADNDKGNNGVQIT